LHIFDDRMSQRFSAKSIDIGACVHCAGFTSNFENCADVACNRLVLMCEACHPVIKFCENHETATTNSD
jgi:predicted sulfurtransferase